MSESLLLNIAGFNIKINFKKTEWEFAYKQLSGIFFENYQGLITEDTLKIDFTIDIVETSQLYLIREKSKRFFLGFFQRVGKNKIITYYQISIIQFQVVLREILVELLTKNNGFIIHGSAVGKDGLAYIFTGRNGAGKSTAMTLLNPEYNALADDTVIIKNENGKYYLYQTPFIEKNDWIYKTSKKYLIKSVFFIKKSLDFNIDNIKNKEMILKKMTNQFWSSGTFYKKQFKYLLEFVNDFDNFNYLFFAKDKDKLVKLIKKNSSKFAPGCSCHSRENGNP